MGNDNDVYGGLSTAKTKEKRWGMKIPKADTGKLLSVKAYNAALAGLLLYGFAANAIVCLLFTEQVWGMNPFVLIGGYLVSSFAGIFVAHLTANPALRFLGFNLVVVPSGMIVASILPLYHFETVMHALIGTALIAGIMLVAAVVRPRTFEGLGPVLILSLVSAFVVELFMLFIFHSSSIFIDIAVVIVMACFVGFDFVQANKCTRTLNNAVAFAIDLYMDILNIFIRLMSILGHRD